MKSQNKYSQIGISNLAWESVYEHEVLQTLRSLNVHSLEIAPTKIWQFPTEVSPESAQVYRQLLEKQNFKIISAQSLLFGMESLNFFDPDFFSQHQVHLKKIMHLCKNLGVQNLVYGSPKNRQKKDLPMNAAQEIASNCFSELGNEAQQLGLTLCLEAVSAHYGCDFLNNLADLRTFILRLNHPRVRMNFDLGNAMLNREDVTEEIHKNADIIAHAQISQPQLTTFALREVDENILDQLLALKIPVTVEMKSTGAKKEILSSIQSLYT